MLCLTKIIICVLVLPSVLTENSAVDGWSKLHLSSQVFASIPFSTFLVNVYEHSKNSERPDLFKRYYYAPLSLLNPSATTCRWKNVTEEYEVDFQVIMWTTEENTELLSQLQLVTGFKLIPLQLQILPFERITLKSTKNVDKFRVSTQWKSYANQPQTVTFGLVASDKSACEMVSTQLRFYPADFDYLYIYFALESQISERRETNITVQNVLRGKFFQQLQQFSGPDQVVFLTSHDESRLLSETSSNIQTRTFTVLEVLDNNEEVQIWDEVREMLSSTRISTSSKDFSDLSWNSVYWSDSRFRPDRIAKSLNALYSNSNEHEKKGLEKTFSEHQDLPSRSDAINESRKSAGVLATSPETFDAMMREGKKTVIWTGEKFVPKLQTLVKISLASQQQEKNYHNRNIKVKYCSSILRTHINHLSPEQFSAVFPSGSSIVDQGHPELEKAKSNGSKIEHTPAEKQDPNFVLLNQKFELLQTAVLNLTTVLDAAWEARTQDFGEIVLTKINGSVAHLRQARESIESTMKTKTELLQSQVMACVASVTGLEAKFMQGQTDVIKNHTSSLAVLKAEMNMAQATTMSNIMAKIDRLEAQSKQGHESIISSIKIKINEAAQTHLAAITASAVGLQTKFNQVQENIKNDLRTKIDTVAQNQLQMYTSALKEETRKLLYKEPCIGTTLRVTGKAVTSKLQDAPLGIICIGNGLAPNPKKNFLVFRKHNATSQPNSMVFIGTQSVKGGFVDFTEYVTWSFWTSDQIANRKHVLGEGPRLHECSSLPYRLRGAYNGTGARTDCCSRANLSGQVYLVDSRSGCADGVVDNDGAITVIESDNETLWY